MVVFVAVWPAIFPTPWGVIDVFMFHQIFRNTLLHAGYELKIHDKELNNHLRDLNDGKALDDIEDEPAQHEVDYTFGDSGSQWRMTKLKGWWQS